METQVASNDLEEFVNLTYEEKLAFASPISQPMASRKLAKKVVKLLNKAHEHKKVFISVKDTLKQILKKDQTGIVVLGGDVSPIDLITHVPIVCEEKSIPYVYVPMCMDIGTAMELGESSIIAFITRDEEYGELFDEIHSKVDSLAILCK